MLVAALPLMMMVVLLGRVRHQAAIEGAALIGSAVSNLRTNGAVSAAVQYSTVVPGSLTACIMLI
jgi:fructose-1,6-bisphosphatase/sedoheptulose 1,7-bisphosphatase-like protein